jgi:hypothetical protein
MMDLDVDQYSFSQRRSCPSEGTGWGHCIEEEADDLKKKFETEFGGSLEKFHQYWPQGFRWTCCGTDAGISRFFFMTYIIGTLID